MGNDKLNERHIEAKAEHKAIQKTLEALKAREANLKNELTRLDIVIQVRRAFPNHTVGYPLYYR